MPKITKKETALEKIVQDRCFSANYLSMELRDNKEVMIEAVKKSGMMLCYASERLKKADCKIVLILPPRPISLAILRPSIT